MSGFKRSRAATTVAFWFAAFSTIAGSSGADNFGALLQGRFIFEKNCVICHGRRGDGNGEWAARLDPPPRDFRAGLFKFRSTPPGAMPTDDDLMRTIRGGLGGTAMPVFSSLPERDVRAVIEYVKTLSPRWRDPANRKTPVPIPEPPEWVSNPKNKPSLLERGRACFLASCSQCHGEQGRGNGPAAATLRDGQDRPIRPRDLREAPLRAGETARDIYRTLTTGLDGTPMPSFAETLTFEQRWEIVAFLLDLRRVSSPGK